MILLFIVLILSGISAVLVKLTIWRRNCSMRMPGSRPSIFNPLGDSLLVVIAHLTTTPIHLAFYQRMQEFFERYKSKSLFCLWLLYEPFVIFIKADAVKELLKGTAFIEKSWIYDFLKPVFGKGLLTSGGSKWKTRRKMLSLCFHKEILEEFQVTFDEHSRKLADFFQGETKKEFTYIKTPLSLASLDMICETMFGVSVGALDNEYSEYVKAVHGIISLFMDRLQNFWIWPDFVFKCTHYYKKQVQCANLLQEFTKSVIREKKERYLKNGFTHDRKKRKALMDLLLDRYFKFQDITEDDIREEVDTFILEGHDTIAVSLQWALFLVGHNPDVQAKIHNELDDAFGKEVDAPITVYDIKKLEYMECVLKEANRVYTTVPMFARQVQEETKICGYTIPKGATCVISAQYLHKDETVFPDPERFDPDRFLPENAVNIPESGYIPFSSGPRDCIGKTFAMMEMKTIMAALLRRFEVHSLDSRDNVQPLSEVTLNPMIPIRIRFRCRK